MALLIQAPLVAMVLCAIDSWSFPATEGDAGRQASLLFWLGLSAVWFGLSNAVVGELLGGSQFQEGSHDVANHLRVLARSSLTGIFQCLVAWIIVSRFSGLGGVWLVSLGLLILVSGVGLALGCLIVSLDLKPRVRLLALAIVMVPLWLFGGGPQSMNREAPWAKVVSNVMPTRWAFEGLLLLESNIPATREVSATSGHQWQTKIAERYFPSDSERMGTKADVMALVSMLLGLVAASTYFTWSSRVDRAAT